jgi:hypothetical protein
MNLIEADFETLPEERRCFAIFNIRATYRAKPPAAALRLRTSAVHRLPLRDLGTLADSWPGGFPFP